MQAGGDYGPKRSKGTGGSSLAVSGLAGDGVYVATSRSRTLLDCASCFADNAVADMVTVEVWVDKPKPTLLTFECVTSPDGHIVPRLTRRNVAQLIYWLWEFDPEAGPLEGGSTIPYLLDDLMEILGGGVFSI